MRNRYRLAVTYDVVTPESASEGMAAESGFSQTSQLVTLRDAVNELINRYNLENFDPRGMSQSLYECDGSMNYATAAETREAVHVDPNRRFKNHARAMHWLNVVLKHYNKAEKLHLH